MSKPSLKRYRAGRAHMRDKDQLIDFLRDEIGNIVGEIDDAFKGITFEDNFAGKIIEIPIEGLRETRIANPFGKTPSGWIVLRSNVPDIIEGNQFDQDWLTFVSHFGLFVETTVGFGALSVNTGADDLEIGVGNNAFYPLFREGMQCILRNDLGTSTAPGGLSFDVPYWVRPGTTSLSAFSLSLEKNGPIINLTSIGSGEFKIAAYGTVKILLLR